MVLAAASSSPPFMINSDESTLLLNPSHNAHLQSSEPDAGKSLDSERSSLPPSIGTRGEESLSSSSTSVPRSRLQDLAGSTEHDAKHAVDLSDTTAVIQGSGQSAYSRTVSAGRSVNGPRKSVKNRPGTPGRVLSERSTPPVPSCAPPLPTQVSTNTLGSKSLASSSPTSGTELARLTSSPSLGGLPPALPSRPSFPQRRPSLATPLPPTPIVPSTPLPKTVFRLVASSASNPLLSPSTQIRHQQHHHTASDSLPSQQSPQTHHQQNAMTTVPIPSATTSSQLQGQGWSHAQYLSVPRPGTGTSTIPDSPSTRALMKRLLANPAPISPSRFSVTSESESDVGSNSHPRTRKKDVPLFSPTRNAALSDGFHQRERVFVGDGGLGIEIDVNLDLLDQSIASMGQFVGTHSDRYFEKALSKSPNEAKEKERDKDKERRPRNILRRRPSANKQLRQAPSPQLSPSASAVLPPSVATSSNQTIIAIPFSPIAFLPSFSTCHEPKRRQPPRATSKTEVGNFRQQQKADTMPDLNSLVTMSISTTRASSQQTVSTGGTPVLTPSSQPPIPSGSSGPANGAQGNSPAKSPIDRMTPSSPVAPQSERQESDKTGDEEKDGVSVATPAACLIEAYKRREREREEQRIAIERVKERQLHFLQEQKDSEDSKEKDGSTPTTRTTTPTPASEKLLLGGEARSRSAPPTRRNNLSAAAVSTAGDGIDDGDRKRSSVTEEKKIDGVEKQRKIGRANGSLGLSGVKSADVDHNGVAVNNLIRSKEVHPFGSGNASESGHSSITPRFEGGSPGKVLGSGRRFEAIEKTTRTAGRIADSAGMVASSTQKEERVRSTPMKSKTVSSGSPVVKLAASESSHLRTQGDEEEVVAPYYTVFGGTSGSVVTVGSPEDSKWDTYHQGYWDSNMLGRRTPISDKEKDKPKESLGRSLTRKVSGRRKKQVVAVVGTLDASAREGRLRGRSSMNETRVGGSTWRNGGDDEEMRMRMKNRRSLRLSIDKFSDVVEKEYNHRLASSPRATKNRDLHGDTEYGTTLSKAKKVDGGGPGGNRFWDLIRRISAGGLREEYHDTVLPPPVPSLPKDFDNLQPSRSNDSSLRSRHSETPKRKSASAFASPTHVTPGMKASPKSRAVASSPPRPTQPHRSTTSLSSSPVSADLASLKSFHFPHSTYSSTSSFAEDGNPPPLPKVRVPPFDQHIIAPSELDKAAEDNVGPLAHQRPRKIPIANELMDGDWAIIQSPIVELTSLSLPPPRRPALNLNLLERKVPQLDRPESPAIPSFSTNDAVNTFSARNLSATLSAQLKNSPNSARASPATATEESSSLTTSLPPPPRPPRSAFRGVPALVQQQPFDNIPSGRRSESDARIQHDHRSSVGLSSLSASTLRRRSSSIGQTISSYRSLSPFNTASDTMFTFRELDGLAGPKKHELTEKEKADKWDHLMERIARAGGTLHLAGGGMLPSDTLN